MKYFSGTGTYSKAFEAPAEWFKPGANALEIKVVNLWVNRLIGDKQPGVAKTYTYTAVEFYKADSPLLPSGLLGPVKILKVE